MREILEKAIDSYKLQVKTITGLINQVIQLLKDFHLEQEELLVELRNLLAQATSLRKRDFDKMIEDIRSHRRLREAEVTQIVENFLREEEAMIAELRSFLNSGQLPTVADFMITKENLLTPQKAREREISTALKNFYLEQEELGSALKRLLSKGDGIRIRDFKKTIKGIQTYWGQRESEVTNVFEEFERVREEVEAEWQKTILVGKPRLKGRMELSF